MGKKNICIGLLAHVDAGKTTLAEALLYTAGGIRSFGRVDHGDTFLDNYSLERDRGITIFSKQALLSWGDLDITILDTPGHADFGAEMERTLQVLDAAILVISGTDGVQGHTETLWKLLKIYGIPTFIFVNKMDREDTQPDKLMVELTKKLSSGCVNFAYISPEKYKKPDNTWDENDDTHFEMTFSLMEDIAACDGRLLEEYLETDELSDESIMCAIADRKIFPCFFASALFRKGITSFLEAFARFACVPKYGEEFAARVYKITRDGDNNRLTHMKITGGFLKAKQLIGSYAVNTRGELSYEKQEDNGAWQEEKVDQIRIYNGAKYKSADIVHAGGICAVKGLKHTFAGQGLGAESEIFYPTLESVLVYGINFDEKTDKSVMLSKLKTLEEENPELHIVWNEEFKEIQIQVMGEIQIEVLKSIIKERFGEEVTFGEGSIVYKETIAASVEGIGHYEPLRHYAEVHLLLEPAERGSGLQFASLVSDDELDQNWQRLVLTHLGEKSHVGVLTGSEITDMRIALVAGKAHIKHTEGGDFRQASYRALRQGLMKAESILLEPVYNFELEVPTECVGRAMSDIKRMYGEFEGPVVEGDISILTGHAPVETIRDYQREVSTYTRGRGKLSMRFAGYEPCHNTEEVIEKRNYRPELDISNPAYSVFCSHGAGCVVEWEDVDSYAHVESRLKPEILGKREKHTDGTGESNDIRAVKNRNSEDYITQEEIEEIFARTYGKKKEDSNRFRRYHKSKPESRDFGGSSYGKKRAAEKKENYLLVDGYNIIFAWDELRELSEVNIDSARDKLVDIMCNYQGFTGDTLILVFDAYKVKNNPGSVVRHNNIYVVYTKEAETADQYIEKTVHDIGHKYNVTVATSDRLEQMIIWGGGASRMSAGMLEEAVRTAARQMREEYIEKETKMNNRPFEEM